MTELEKQLFELGELLEKCNDPKMKEGIQFCFDNMNELHNKINQLEKKPCQ